MLFFLEEGDNVFVVVFDGKPKATVIIGLNLDMSYRD